MKGNRIDHKKDKKRCALHAENVNEICKSKCEPIIQSAIKYKVKQVRTLNVDAAVRGHLESRVADKLFKLGVGELVADLCQEAAQKVFRDDLAAALLGIERRHGGADGVLADRGALLGHDRLEALEINGAIA